MNRETLRKQANVLRNKKNTSRIRAVNATSISNGIVRLNSPLPHDSKNLRAISMLESSIETREVRRRRISERIAKRNSLKSKKLKAAEKSKPNGKGCGKCRRKLGG